MKILMLESAHLDCLIKVGGYHFANLFSEDRDNFVFYISSPVSFFHLFGKNFKNTLSRLKNWISFGKFYKDNLFGYVPFTIFPIYNRSIFKSRFVIENSLKFTFPNIKSILRKHNFLNVDVIILSHILLYSTLDFVNYKLSIYRMTDDIEKFSQIPKHIKDVEKKTIEKTDIVVVTAKNLLKKVNDKEKEIYYIPNGVDFDFFNNASDKTPSEYFNIPEPRVVYVGVVDYWFDLELIKYCAENLKDFSFVIIGPVKINLPSIRNFKNVFLLGEKNYQLIPAYLKKSQCGIIPFKSIELTQSVSPIKLYEYFSCGLPCVATETEELKKIKSPAILCKSKEEFKSAIVKAIDIKERDNFVEYARKSSWRERFNLLKKIIEDKIKV